MTTKQKCHLALCEMTSQPRYTFFYVWGPSTLRLRRYDVFKLSCDYWVEMLRDFFGTHSCWVITLLCLESTGFVKVEVYRFLFVTWPLGWCVTWLLGWGALILSHHPTKFGVHRPWENEDIAFFIYHVSTISKCHLTLWVWCLHLKSLPC